MAARLASHLMYSSGCFSAKSLNPRTLTSTSEETDRVLIQLVRRLRPIAETPGVVLSVVLQFGFRRRLPRHKRHSSRKRALLVGHHEVPMIVVELERKQSIFG